MRNLKRALSLAVASVMLLGMMVVGAGAASYTDVDSSDNLEAIEVLKMVNLMVGDQGAFKPDSPVNRYQMAVIVTNLMGYTPGGSHPFTDIAPGDAWAEPYVAACYNNGIVGGTSPTTFSGRSTVTAAQAALMLAKPLGYFGYPGEFGDDWKVSVIKFVDKVDLFEGVDAYADKPMLRNDIAQLTLNALESDVTIVTQEGGVSVSGNGMDVQVQPTYKYEGAEDRANHNYDGSANNSYRQQTQQLVEKLFGSNLRKNADSVDAFGRPSNSWTYKTESITAPKEADLTYTKGVKGKEIYNDLGKPSGLKVVDSVGYYSNQVLVNGAVVAAPAGLALVSGNETTVGGNGTLTEVYMDDESREVNIVSIQTFLAQATGDYDAKDEELDIVVYGAGGATPTLSADDFDIAGYVDDDYILVTGTGAGASFEVKSIAPADVVSDVKVSEFKNTDYVIAGGTKYTYNDSSETNTAAVGYALMTNGAGYSLQNNTYDIILDSYGYAIGVEIHSEEADLEDYLFVNEAGKAAFDVQAKVVFMDGTTATVTVAKTAKAGGTLTDINVGSWADSAGNALTADGQLNTKRFYTYDVNSSGEYELTDVTYQAKGTEIDPDTTPAVVLGTTYAANNNTVFIADGSVYTGVKGAPETGTANAVYALGDKDGYLLAAWTKSAGSVSSAAAELVYIYNYDKPAKGEDADDNDYYVYSVVKDGVKTTISTTVGSQVTANGLYEISGYKDGYVNNSAGKLDAIGNNAVGTDEFAVYTGVTKMEYKAGTLNITGTSDDNAGNVLADDVVIYVIEPDDSHNVRSISTSSIKALDFSTGGSDTVYLVRESKDDMVVETVIVILDEKV